MLDQIQTETQPYRGRHTILGLIFGIAYYPGGAPAAATFISSLPCAAFYSRNART